ncbi:hypothetical protein [Pseudomonas phage vB_Pa-PAC2]|nr:hypothetical protein Deiofobo_0354 [Pseudomonas phage Deifobo]WPK40068.1 hypothetical protein ETTORE_0359 [Pseudomonas phage Ettore]WPK40586.1 hypothetical protein Paride_0356 [Pseudomonas phage Paride]
MKFILCLKIKFAENFDKKLQLLDIISIVHLSCIEQKRSTLLSTRKSK